jgi:hypothetical protein
LCGPCRAAQGQEQEDHETHAQVEAGAGEVVEVKWKDGQRVFVSESYLRRRHAGWRVPYVEWHLGQVVDDGMLIAIPQHAVNVDTEDLADGDFLLVA